MQKIHATELHAKVSHPGEDRMRATEKNLNYSFRGMIEVYKDCAMAKSKQKLLQEVVEERNLKPVKLIYLDITPQKKPTFEGSKN